MHTFVRFVWLVLFIALVWFILSVFAYRSFLKANGITFVVTYNAVAKPSQVLAIETIDIEVVITCRCEVSHRIAIPHIDGAILVVRINIGDRFTIGIE